MAARLQAILGHLGYPTLILTGSTAAALQSFAMGAFAGSTKKTAIENGVDSSVIELGPTSAKEMLHRLAVVVQTSHDKLHPLVREAYGSALDAARAIEGFAEDHPVFCLVVALGILCILAPPIMHLLGFTSKGPALGSFAASWQSTFGGTVPAKSLFAYLQSLGMIM